MGDADAPPLPPEPSATAPADTPAPPIKQEHINTEQPIKQEDPSDPPVKQELGEAIDYANADELLKAR